MKGGWRKWIGDAIVVTLLVGPGLAAPFAIAGVSDAHTDDRPIIALMGFALVGTAALLLSIWRRVPTWHLLSMPAITIACFAMSARWATGRSFEDDKTGMAAVVGAMARTQHLRSMYYWAGAGLAVTLFLGFTALVWAASARIDRPLRSGFWRAGAFAIALFGSLGIAYLALERKGGRLDEFLVVPVGCVIAFATLTVFVAGGSDQADETSRTRAFLASLYAITSVVCAVLGCSLDVLGDIWAYSSDWSEIGADAERMLERSTLVTKYGALFSLPITIAAVLVLRPWPFWRSRTVRLAGVAALAPAIVLAALLVRSRQTMTAIVEIDLPIPKDITLLRAPVASRSSVDPEDVVFFGDRIRRGESDLGPIGLLDDVVGRQELRKRLEEKSGWVVAVDASISFQRMLHLMEAVGRCEVPWIVADRGHTRSAHVYAVRTCAAIADDVLDVTVDAGGQGLDVARTTGQGMVLEPPKGQTVDELAKRVREIAELPDEEHTRHGAILRAPASMKLADLMPAYGAIVGVQKDDERSTAYFDVAFAPIEIRNEIVDAQALAASLDDGLAMCREKHCTVAAWKKLILADAERYARNDNRQAALESAFVVLALDRSGLDGSSLEPTIIRDAKELVQPFQSLSPDGELPKAITSVVEANEGALRMCVAELSLRRTIRKDTWKFKVTVGADGLSANLVGEGSLSRGNARNCIERAFRAMRFEPGHPIETRWILAIGEEDKNDFGPRRGPGGLVAPAVQIRMGTVQVTGALPVEVIQRIVRQSYGRFRLCYENARLEDSGRVTIKFTIDPTGAVASVSSVAPEPGFKDVTACVVRGFYGMSFPEPENKASVTVVYPLLYSSSNE